jgi:phage I-like protein
MTTLVLIDRPDVAVALCAAVELYETANCSATELVMAENGQAPEWVQLLPAGDVKPVDGREPWTNGDPAKVIEASLAALPRMSIDYDHGTNTGGSSRAAGWIKELKAKGPKGEPGIWARVEWTGPGAEAVAAKEYRFLSPVFNFVKGSRQIISIKRAALTNDPALVMTALASAEPNNHPNKETTLDLKALAKLLGLPETATAEDITAAIKAMCDGQGAMAAKKKALCSVMKAAGLAEDFDKFDDTAATAICTKIAAVPPEATEVATLRAALTASQLQVLELQGTAEKKSAEQKVEDAKNAGQITPAQVEVALALCKRDPAAFEAFIKKATPVVKPGKTEAPKGGDTKAGELDEGQLAICRMVGLTPEKYAETLKAQANDEEEAS